MVVGGFVFASSLSTLGFWGQGNPRTCHSWSLRGGLWVWCSHTCPGRSSLGGGVRGGQVEVVTPGACGCENGTAMSLLVPRCAGHLPGGLWESLEPTPQSHAPHLGLGHFWGGGGGAGFPQPEGRGLSGKSGIHVHGDYKTWHPPHPMCQ
jgi:hypothetical protein